MTYGPYDPTFETPDKGGPSGRLTRASIPYASQSSRVQLAVLKPAHLALSRAPGSFALRYVPRVAGAPTILIHVNQPVAPHGSISLWPGTPELVEPQMRLDYNDEAHRLLSYCCQKWSEALRFLGAGLLA